MASGAWIVIVILVVLVGGANLIAYGIARGMFRSDNASALNNLGKSLDAARKKNGAMDELRRRMEELEKNKQK